MSEQEIPIMELPDQPPTLPNRPPQQEIGYVPHHRRSLGDAEGEQPQMDKKWKKRMNEKEANPEVRYFDIFQLSEEQKAELADKIKGDNGLVRMFVHPYYEVEDGPDKSQNRVDQVLSAVLENKSAPATIIMEDYEQIERLYELIKAKAQDDVYIAPSFQSRGEPYPTDESKLDILSDDNWQIFTQLLKELGVESVFLGGMYVLPNNVASKRPDYSGCMGSAFNHLSEYFKVTISNGSNFTRQELKDFGYKQIDSEPESVDQASEDNR